MDYGDYRAVRSFDSLQQWRTISVLLVLTYHMQDPLWGPVRGYIGVAIFFVISGFLITTLLLREEADRGVASLRGFYIRRAFRILPLYYLALLLFALPILGAGLGGQVADFKRALPFYLTYQNDLTGSAPFGHSWSLAIEEKFYLLWPAALLLLPLVRRRRLPACLVLLAASCVSPLLGSTYPSHYAPILAGCAVALVLHDERGYRLTRLARTPAVTVVALLLSVVGLWKDDVLVGHSLFALPFAVALAGMVTHRYRVAELVPLVALGTYTYGFYLLHPLVKSTIDVALPAGQHGPVVQLARFVLATGLTFAVAALTYRAFEGPLTRYGHRLSKRARTGAGAPETVVGPARGSQSGADTA